MPLKFKVKTLDDIPEASRTLYKESDGEFVLDIEGGVVPKGEADGFKNTAFGLRKELEKYKDVDPEEYRALKDKLKEMEGQTGKEKQQTKEEMQRQIDAMKTSAEKAAKDLQAQIESRDVTIQTLMIDKEVSLQASEVGVRPEALIDVIQRAKAIFKLENGVVVAYKGNGDKWYSDATGEILKIGEWFKVLVKDAPHLFKESQGTGSTGGATGGKQKMTGDNPWKTGNRTDQALAIKADINRARALAKEAGVRVTF